MSTHPIQEKEVIGFSVQQCFMNLSFFTEVCNAFIGFYKDRISHLKFHVYKMRRDLGFSAVPCHQF